MIDRATRKSRSQGQSLVEFTLALPVFLLVMLAIAEGGYYVAATTAVSHATHEGARLGVLESTADLAAVRQRIEDQAVALVTLADDDIAFKLNGASCDDACYSGRGAGDRLAITTTYTHRPLVSYVFSQVGFPANAQAELLVE